MDYDKFKDEYFKFEKDFPMYTTDRIDWSKYKDDPVEIKEDRVNSPSHYRAGSQEAIDIIEDAIRHAPGSVEGMLQAQVLKYILRLWHKDNTLEDARKANWYLERLISKLAKG